jgi:hypothetical protein
VRLAYQIVASILLIALPAHGDDVVRIRGGGLARTDCMVVTDVVAGAAAADGRRLRCTDGDPACDADGAPNGVCTLTARVCLDAPGVARCLLEPLTHAALVTASPSLAELATAVDALTMPVEIPDTCTPMARVEVATRGRRSGRVVMQATARMASGPADHDRITLLCRPAPRPVALATVQRLVFTPSCASVSCHGAARAGGLDLSPDAVGTSLLGVPASNDVAHTAGLLRVVPGNAENSFLLRKITGALAPGEGAAMPRVGGMLPPARIDLVRRWIAGL